MNPGDYFIHLFNKYLLSAYSMTDLVPDAGIRVANKADKNTCPQEDAILMDWSCHTSQPDHQSVHLMVWNQHPVRTQDWQ